MAVAIVQTAFIGDVVLATPLFEAARVSNPGERVIAVVRAGCDTLLAANPHVDDIIVWDKHGRDRGIGGIRLMASRLRDAGIGLALIPHRSFRSSLMVRLAGVPVRIGFDRGSGRFLHTIRVPYPRGPHEVERNLLLARAAGWQWEGFRPAVFTDERDWTIVADLTRGADPYCVLAPGSVWPTKRWPPEYYLAVGTTVADRGVRVFLSGGIEDTPLCEAIARDIPGAVSTCGILTLRQSAELYRRAAFVLTGDTAPQHIAAAAGTRVFTLFGPTVREFGFWPYTDRGVVIEEDLACRPCGVHGHVRCPEGTHRCMRAITPERVTALILECFEGDAASPAGSS